MYTNLIKFIRDLYGTEDFIPLHAPTFTQRDKDYVMDAIDSTFMSSVGQYVNRFEQDPAAFTGAAPVFVDVDKDTMGLSPDALKTWLKENTEIKVEVEAKKSQPQPQPQP
jgi:dTDP-4-amino-4,6-dideoxygalactose transaminase